MAGSPHIGLLGSSVCAICWREAERGQRMRRLMLTMAACLITAGAAAKSPACGQGCLEAISAQYRAAYVAHDPKAAPFAAKVRFTENNVAMAFPEGTWDTVTRELGPALTVSDPVTGNVGVYTAILQGGVPGFLAIRLRIRNRRIVEAEHVVATARYLAPPVSLGDVATFVHDPDLARPVPSADRIGRAELIRLADGYFRTLQNNDGTLHTAFSPTVTRSENGTNFPGVEKGFRNGFYRFNDRVRDRDFFLVDEARGIVMGRAFIDHKGRLDRYRLTDGSDGRSPYQEPQTWALLELFQIRKNAISSIEATFVQVPYYMPTSWPGRP